MSADDESVDRAIDAARCREIIDRLPDGLMTKIGTDGTYLSGGEQQRIALARAILKDAPVVVLDEATASVDVENETLIQSALSELVRDRTVLIIAHRMRTVSEADRIVVLSGEKWWKTALRRSFSQGTGPSAGCTVSRHCSEGARGCPDSWKMLALLTVFPLLF